MIRMVSQRDKKEINQLKEDIEYFENLSEISSVGDKEQYKKIVSEYKIQLQSLESKIEKQKPKKVIKKGLHFLAPPKGHNCFPPEKKSPLF